MTNEPKYKAVADELRREIADHTYQDGQTLLTELELARRYEVSRQTIRQAISLLEQDGLVIRRRGSGTFVTHRPRKRFGPLTVGVMTTYITDYIFPSIVRGIESELSKEDCMMTLCVTYNRVDRERALLQRFLETPPDGLIVEGTKTALPNPNTALYQRLMERNIPIVFINGFYPELSDCPHVVMDDLAGGEMATKYLINHGKRKIAGLFKSDDMQGHNRYQGFVKAMLAGSLTMNDETIGWFSTENRENYFAQAQGAAFLSRLKDCDALVCYNDDMALRLIESLREQGGVPDTLSIISFDNSAFAGVCYPRLTSLDHPKDRFGVMAAQKLLARLQGENAASAALGWTIEERDSVRK